MKSNSVSWNKSLLTETSLIFPRNCLWKSCFCCCSAQSNFEATGRACFSRRCSAQIGPELQQPKRSRKASLSSTHSHNPRIFLVFLVFVFLQLQLQRPAARVSARVALPKTAWNTCSPSATKKQVSARLTTKAREPGTWYFVGNNLNLFSVLRIFHGTLNSRIF